MNPEWLSLLLPISLGFLRHPFIGTMLGWFLAIFWAYYAPYLHEDSAPFGLIAAIFTGWILGALLSFIPYGIRVALSKKEPNQ
jgi:hypothetical protein